MKTPALDKLVHQTHSSGGGTTHWYADEPALREYTALKARLHDLEYVVHHLERAFPDLVATLLKDTKANTL